MKYEEVIVRRYSITFINNLDQEQLIIELMWHFPFAETPLTIAAGLKTPGKVLIALVNGGALLDYRTKDGSTAMHRAIEKNSLESVKTLLELGGSPNYKDAKGQTPLYLSVTNKTDPLLCETLLHDHATIGATDLQGWLEVHQVGCQTLYNRMY